MAAKIISGAEIASSIREEIKTDVAKLKDNNNIVPGLVTIIVGKNPA